MKTMVSDRLHVMKAPALKDTELDEATLEFIALWASTVDWTKYEEAIALVDLNSIYFFLSEDASYGPTSYDCAVRTSQGWCLIKDKRKAARRAHGIARIMTSQPDVADISKRWCIHLPSTPADDQDAMNAQDDGEELDEDNN